MRKILIVEDDILLNRTLGYNLASDGYEITAAYNHKDAVSHLKETEFDVALLDINLPDGSGLDLCEEIRERGQHTYIIFITANDKESDMLKGYEAGGADYVTKPFSVTVLCRKVAAVISSNSVGCSAMASAAGRTRSITAPSSRSLISSPFTRMRS